MITAVIPVRAGSTRVKDKNIKKFSNTSLLENKIQQLKEIEEIDQIIVSSDSDEMLSVAEKLGVLAVRRPPEFCDEKTKSFNEVVEHIAKNEVQTDIMMWTPCVCPLIKNDSIKKGIALFKEKVLSGETDYDSVASCVSIKEYIFDEKGPINFSVENHVKSQDLPDWHYVVNGFFIAQTKMMESWKFVYGKKPYLMEIGKYEAIDIDDEMDFKVAELLFERLGRECEK